MSAPTHTNHSGRFDRLHEVFRLAVLQTFKRLMEPDRFASCFSEIASKEGGEASLEVARQQAAEYFVSTSLRQFEHTCDERNVELRLNELEEIIASAQTRMATNSGPQIHVDRLSASQIVNSAVSQSKYESVEKLSQIYNQLCLDNAALYQELKEHAEECENLKNGVISLVDALQKGIDELRGLSFDEVHKKLTEEVFAD